MQQHMVKECAAGNGEGVRGRNMVKECAATDVKGVRSNRCQRSTQQQMGMKGVR